MTAFPRGFWDYRLDPPEEGPSVEELAQAEEEGWPEPEEIEEDYDMDIHDEKPRYR